jgi:LmbE family N-acetylglucosaminyl deacetylase
LILVKNMLNRLLKFFARKARPYLKTYGLLQTSKVFNTSALVWNPGNERIVVLAPHMDDEVIGCGGTIARHVAAGSEVSVIFLTDGRRRGDAIGATRKGEARRALQELGVHRIEFLDAADGGLMEAATELAAKLRAHLQRIRPALVYLPFFLEEHPDHRAASLLLLEAMQGVQLTFHCHGYEVWTPLFPNCLVRIDETIENKRRSLTHYQSQLAEADYMHTALGLNAYRSNAFLGETCRFAEAFCVLPVSDYLALYQTYRAAR